MTYAPISVSDAGYVYCIVKSSRTGSNPGVIDKKAGVPGSSTTCFSPQMPVEYIPLLSTLSVNADTTNYLLVSVFHSADASAITWLLIVAVLQASVNSI